MFKHCLYDKPQYRSCSDKGRKDIYIINVIFVFNLRGSGRQDYYLLFHSSIYSHIQPRRRTLARFKSKGGRSMPYSASFILSVMYAMGLGVFLSLIGGLALFILSLKK